MADIEAKLNMSLDELAKKERKPQRGGHRHGGQPQQGNRPYQQQQGGRGGYNRQSNHQNGGMQYREPQQQWVQQPQQWQQQQQQQQWNQQQSYPMLQQQWGTVGPQRRDGKQSVFARLSGAATEQQVQQPGPPLRRQPQQHYPRQQGQQQMQQPQAQQQQPPAPKPKLSFRVDPNDGFVILSHSQIDIVKVGPAGEVVLDSGEDRSPEMLAAFNAALAPIKISVKAPGPDASIWSVSDGKGLLRFQDGMKLPAKGHLTAGRAMVLMQTFASGSSKAAAAAAQEASRQAAIAAGILPAAAAAGGPTEAPETADAAQIRRLKAQGRYHPY